MTKSITKTITLADVAVDADCATWEALNNSVAFANLVDATNAMQKNQDVLDISSLAWFDQMVGYGFDDVKLMGLPRNKEDKKNNRWVALGADLKKLAAHSITVSAGDAKLKLSDAQIIKFCNDEVAPAAMIFEDHKISKGDINGQVTAMIGKWKAKWSKISAEQSFKAQVLAYEAEVEKAKAAGREVTATAPVAGTPRMAKSDFDKNMDQLSAVIERMKKSDDAHLVTFAIEIASTADKYKAHNKMMAKFDANREASVLI
jgi:hypothetical protein